MPNLLKTTIRMITKPRETARNLIEENNYDLSYWYFLFLIFLDFSYRITFGKDQIPHILIFGNVWRMTINALGFSILITVLGLLLQSTIMNLVSKIFKIRSNFRKTMLCITWSRGPYILIIAPVAILILVLGFAEINGKFMLSFAIWDILLILITSIIFLAFLITIIIQIILFSELFQRSILKTIILHIAAYLTFLGIIMLGVFFFVETIN